MTAVQVNPVFSRPRAPARLAPPVPSATPAPSTTPAPASTPAPPTPPVPPAPDKSPVLRAKRCLFGPADSAEIARIQKEEADATMKKFNQRFVIIGPLLPNLGQIPTDAEESNGESSERLAPNPPSTTSVLSNPSQSERRVQCNPGILSYFREKRRQTPYSRQTKEPSLPAPKGSQEETSPSRI